ncbi:tyrosine-type recombinase/integrase [Roseomonas terrae]|uniref:Tyrosine-type recombinase/integrase n=1 Tax=Neoroseomonas terrae TaxID=424799 RepID=A0ABS5EM17_9PROT|nr:site-specific integrase [Neoroseomonas terrae]MBR0652059.1 tyrosine-type recombinase/integrase [Neoroseomonas terrae]
MAEGTKLAPNEARKGAVTAISIAALAKGAAPGLYGAGDSLYLQKTAAGGASWLFRFRWHGRRCDMGLGRYDAKGKDGVTLAQARRAVDDAKASVRGGRNPIVERRAARADLAAEACSGQARGADSAITFQSVAEAYIKRHEPGWKSAKHGAQWAATLSAYAYPLIGATHPAEVTVQDVVTILNPIWTKKPETAARVRGRIEAVLDAAKVQGMRSGENAAAWKGNLALLMPKRSNVRAVEHHPALPWEQAPSFMAALAKKSGMAAQALQFAILTAARSGEVRGATWGEIDMAAKIWTIPGKRMKGGREHRVPLAAGATTILHGLRAEFADAPAGDALLFPAPRSRGALSDMALTVLLRKMEKPGTKVTWTDESGQTITAHGFRSSFRDWAAEATHHPREVIEHALAHRLRDKTEAAYARRTLLQKRAVLMADWSAFLLPDADCTVVSLPAGSA